MQQDLFIFYFERFQKCEEIHNSYSYLEVYLCNSGINKYLQMKLNVRTQNQKYKRENQVSTWFYFKEKSDQMHLIFKTLNSKRKLI